MMMCHGSWIMTRSFPSAKNNLHSRPRDGTDVPTGRGIA
ncbi:hypothetical protein GMO_23740 [Gluconobacter morbifer G707]|uniref:Uncharacterized protein n=1 Tax=Gluconobacter morbifer G707 TaxID=1088869 RepID=G6XLX4_9PROT|nr:hypothetical protein GMO_23740 [Gluconobacter morbifer G707]